MLNIREDIRNAMAHDPAVRSMIDGFFNCPGLHAIWMHRINHWMWTRGFRFIARLLATITRAITNIEIHPGAQIGRRLYIDHGSGVVIGETSIIGDDCLFYHGVTLGSSDFPEDRRHPHLGNFVMIGAGAKILGPITVGSNVKIGANAVVLKDIPSNVTVVGIPARIIDQPGPDG